MIDNVADKNPSNDWGRTPLHNAAEKGFVEICQLLIQNSTDKNPSDNDGKIKIVLLLDPLPNMSSKKSSAYSVLC